MTKKKLGAFTTNADLDRFRYVFRKKQDGVALSVYDGKKLIGKVGAITAGNCYPDDDPTMVKYRRPANVVSAEILEEYRGKKLYQEMLLRFRKYAKDELGCTGLMSEGFQRSPMATRAWKKVADRATEPDYVGRQDFFLDGLPKKGGKLAFHTTPGRAIRSVKRDGLHPFPGSATRKEELLFFGEEPQHAYRYFIDREDAYLLRFPFPADAECDRLYEECVSRIPVPPEKIEVYTGKALNKLINAYYIEGEDRYEDRDAVLDQEDTPALRKKMKGKAGWVPLTKHQLGGFSALPKKGRIPLATAKRALNRLGRKAAACKITPAALRVGMEIEREHRDVTRGGVLKTAKIAAAHLCERPDYYTELKKLEHKLKRKG